MQRRLMVGGSTALAGCAAPSVDDWMILIDERVMLNKARMSKFGIRLGEVTLSFTKRD